MEQWQRDLHDLTRKPPAQGVKGVVLRIMRSRIDDRSTALTCGAFAEMGLAAGLAMVQQPNQKQIIEWFWEPGGKYATFDKKIKQAHALHLIGPKTKNDLDVVRRVRNVFAHSMADVRFTTPAIRMACQLIQGQPILPKSSRRFRFAYCQTCDLVFRIFLGHAALRWITLADPRHQELLLP
jgi:hypothetical protein